MTAARIACVWIPDLVVSEVHDVLVFSGPVDAPLAVSESDASAPCTDCRSLDVGDRLYCKLTEFAVSIGRDVDGGIFVEHGLQQGELASSIGASREAVNRQLALWRDQGLITLRRGALLLKDPVGLKMAVSPQARSVDLDIGTPTA